MKRRGLKERRKRRKESWAKKRRERRKKRPKENKQGSECSTSLRIHKSYLTIGLNKRKGCLLQEKKYSSKRKGEMKRKE